MCQKLQQCVEKENLDGCIARTTLLPYILHITVITITSASAANSTTSTSASLRERWCQLLERLRWDARRLRVVLRHAGRLL